jgi:hypothetical protein
MLKMVRAKHAAAAAAVVVVMAGLQAVSVAGEPMDCGYLESGPSLAHATASFKMLDYECAAQELDALLAGDALTRPARADAYMLKGAVIYAQFEDDPARDERTTEQFVMAFRTFPQWRGEPHFAAAHYRSLIAGAKAEVALESGPMLASNAEDPLLAGDGATTDRPRTSGLAAPGRWELGIALGAAVPTGDFKDLAEGGFVFGLNAGYFVTRKLALGIELGPHTFPGSADLVRAARILTGDSQADASWTETQVSGFAKYVFGSGHASPFARFQIGSYRLEAKIDAASASISSTSESNLGVALGGGFQFRGNGLLGGFAEGTFHTVPTDGTDLTFFDLRGGISFWLGR